MTSVFKKESIAQTLLPTPSPSPPLSSQGRTVVKAATLTTVTRRTYSEAERQAHIFLARQCAEQLRVLHLASSAQSVPDATPRDDCGTSRFHLEVERVEGERKVTKRVSVIIPGHFKSLPALTLIPPPHLGDSPSKRPSLFPHTKTSSPSRTRTTPARKASLPSLRTLSLLPTPDVSPPAPFRSRTVAPLQSRSSASTAVSSVHPRTPHSSPSKHHPTPVPALSRPRLPPSINLDTTSLLLQRRKAALSLRFERPHTRRVEPAGVVVESPSRPAGAPFTGTLGKRTRGRSSGSEMDEEESVRTKCARWNRQVVESIRGSARDDGDDGGGERGRSGALVPSMGERVKREREVSLGERRGKKVRSLTLS